MGKANAVLTLEPGWLTRVEALEKLGKSRSTLERLVEVGEVSTKQQEVEGRRPMTLYKTADIERIAAAPPRPPAAPQGSQQLALASDLGNALRALLERQAAPQMAAPAPVVVRLTEKLWLTLDEAVEYSGLAKSDLRELCRLNYGSVAKPPPLVVRKSGGWKILRTSLEAFRG